MTILVPSAHIDTLRVPLVDLTVGGQQGFMPNPYLWSSFAPHVEQQIISILIRPPGALQYLQDAAARLASLKALIELMPTKIEGLQSTLTGDFDGHVVGNAGETLKSATKVSRAVSEPAYTWPELYGQAITRFWTDYMRLLIGDPDLGFPGIVAEPGFITSNSMYGNNPVLTPDMQSFTTLFIQPDITMQNVVNAWLCTNMQPMSGGEITGSREKGGSNKVPEVNIQFTALTQIGQAVNILAKNYLNSLELQNLRPLNLQGFSTQIDPDVAAVTNGLADEISSAAIQNGLLLNPTNVG